MDFFKQTSDSDSRPLKIVQNLDGNYHSRTKSPIHRVGYRPDVSNFLEDSKDKPLPLERGEKGFFINDEPNLVDTQKGLELKEDLEGVAESVDRGYDLLDKATKIKVFKELLRQYKNPILARSKLLELSKRSKVQDKPFIPVDLKLRVERVLGNFVREEGDEEFDFGEFLSFARAWVADDSLQKRSLDLKEDRLPKVGYYIRDLKAAGFVFPGGMERVGETDSRFAKYLVGKYTSILSTIKHAAEDEDEDVIVLLEGVWDDTFDESLKSCFKESFPDKVSNRPQILIPDL